MIEALDIQVKGIVQGVGFRPFIYRIAKKYLIKGWVLNATDGVFIHAEGEAKLLDEFVLEISENPPAASQVTEIDLKEVPLEDFESFEIRFSDAADVEKTTLISPDLATCSDCVGELFNTNDPRYRYPFINCTNCGPRFTIIGGLPYDRKKTSMADFPMCPRCQREYEDPLDRRFHAQPNACFECGPHVSWRLSGAAVGSRAQGAVETPAGSAVAEAVATPAGSAVAEAAGHPQEAGVAEGAGFSVAGQVAESASEPAIEWGTTREQSDAIFTKAVEFLRAGKILAVKGLGGFHLVCDAKNAEAVAALRKRKRREGKAFAVMMRDVDAVRRVCQVNEVEEELLSGSQRPIVLLRKRCGAEFVPGLADGLSELGVMLPYTPIQHILLRDYEGMLVMTSGNLHDEPILTDDEEAFRVLGEVADAFIGHNRKILARYDDSVVRVIAAADAGFSIQFIRRARGYAPLPLALPEPGIHYEDDVRDVESAATAPDCNQSASSKATVSLFATGPEQKNTFCLTRDSEAFVSQHIGDMENAETFDSWLAAKALYERLFEITPQRIACDFHPEYLTTKWAFEQELPLTQVQHHHAHIVSVMAENKLAAPVAGIAFDGTGYGIDKTIWGGEVLLCNFETFERFANFAYVPMPGGAAAIKHPLRMAYGALWAFDLLDHPAAQDALEMLGKTAEICEQMIDKGLNTPLTSSVGRLFDAASALLGICTEPKYEGEGAILLEAAISGYGGVGEDADTYAGKAGSASGTETSAASEQITDAFEQKAAVPEQTDGVYAAFEEPYGTDTYAIELVKNTATAQSTAQDTSVVLLDAASAFKALLDDKEAGVPMSIIARRFHDAFVFSIVQIAQLIDMTYDIRTIALSGGVFMNRYLIEHTIAALTEAGFTVAINRDLPPNDGCISFGQAVVASEANNR